MITAMTQSIDAPSTPSVFTIISGGQTGADRAGLDVAIARGIPHAGWCPKGRKSEDGPLPGCYQLTETRNASYLVRTERNVADSDATVLFTPGALTGGSKRTAEFAKIHGRPLLHIAVEKASDDFSVDRIVAFLSVYPITRLNVAGSRESKAPGIHANVFRLLDLALGRIV